ncbi:MAG TPA: hypothetical protein VFE53_26375 [Mucilaginibacter sp.]|jgi:hypothetical protein|nr:hypothetical protein [Mucilaginibacter sp.]
MKKTIKLAALFLVASAAFVTVASAKGTAAADDQITFSSLPSLRGVEIKVNSTAPSKAIVMIYDANDNVIYKDALPAYKAMQKGYILDQLENGDYTIVVKENHTEVKKEIHVYDENNTKEFIVKQ